MARPMASSTEEWAELWSRSAAGRELTASTSTSRSPTNASSISAQATRNNTSITTRSRGARWRMVSAGPSAGRAFSPVLTGYR